MPAAPLRRPMLLSTLAGLAALTFAVQVHAQASTASLAGWSSFGDVIASGGRITLTTAYRDGDPAGDQPANLSGVSAVDIGTLETAAGVAPFGLDLSSAQYGTEGSLVRQTFGAVAGQTLSFDWSFATLETAFMDRAFVVIGGTVTTLATRAAPGSGVQTFSTRVSSSGPLTLGFGVLDTVDVLGVSSLTIGNLAVVGAVPEPASSALMLAGLAGAATLQQRRRVRSSGRQAPR